MIRRTFRVEQIHCARCENTIRTALSQLPGVSMVVPAAETNQVKVAFDDTAVSEQQLRDRLAEVGFPALAG